MSPGRSPFGPAGPHGAGASRRPPRRLGGRVLLDTLQLLTTRSLRLVVQAIYFIVIARALGAAEYGAFVGVVAIFSIIGPFANLGAGSLLVKNVARDRTLFGTYWGNSFVLNVVGGAILLGVVLAIHPILVPASVSIGLLLSVAIAELFLVRVLHTAAQAFQAFDEVYRTGLLELALASARLIAVLLFVSHDGDTASAWACYYLLSTGVVAVTAVVFVMVKLGQPQPDLSRLRPELGEGVYFAAGLSAQSAHSDVDKAMLARLDGLAATGVYGAAYRVIDVSFQPISALLYATYARSFRAGAHGISESGRLAHRLLPLAGGYAIAVGLVLFTLAPVIPGILGASFAGSVTALRWLAPLPILRAVHGLIGNALAGSGWQGRRTAWIGIASGCNFCLNLWLIPRYSWTGAAAATLVTEALLVVGLLLTMRRLMRAEEVTHRSVSHDGTAS